MNYNFNFLSGFAVGDIFANNLRKIIPSNSSFKEFSFFDSLNFGHIANSLNKQNNIAIGYSLGGMVLLNLASLGLINKVDGLIIIAGTGRLMSADNYNGASEAFVQKMQDSIMVNTEGFYKRFYRSILTTTMPKNLDVMLQSKPSYTKEELCKGLRFLTNFDCRESLKNITKPVLIIHGENDSIVPLDQGKMVAQSIPNSSLVSIAGMAHDMNIMHSKTIQTEIANFIDKVYG